MKRKCSSIYGEQKKVRAYQNRGIHSLDEFYRLSAFSADHDGIIVTVCHFAFVVLLTNMLQAKVLVATPTLHRKNILLVAECAMLSQVLKLHYGKNSEEEPKE